MEQENNEHYITVREYNDPSAVELFQAKEKLTVNEIDFKVTGEEGIVGRRYGASLFCIELKIREKDVERAAQLLSDLKSGDGAGIPSFCPKCDSENIKEKVCFSMFSIFESKKFCCPDCGYVWKPLL